MWASFFLCLGSQCLPNISVPLILLAFRLLLFPSASSPGLASVTPVCVTRSQLLVSGLPNVLCNRGFVSVTSCQKLMRWSSGPTHGRSEKRLLQISHSLPRLACCEHGWVPMKPVQLCQDCCSSRWAKDTPLMLHSLVPLPVPQQPLAACGSLALNPYCHVPGSPQHPETESSLERFPERISQSDK